MKIPGFIAIVKVAFERVLPNYFERAKSGTGKNKLPVSRYSREEKLLAGLDLEKMSGVEIGALASPLLLPSQTNIRYVDHFDQAALKIKYANDAHVAVDKIVAVDAVWGDKTLAECIPGESFDFVIASHVMEHVPDLIGWLSEIASVLREDGRLILAVPDRRYTFDLVRRETSLSDLIDNHLRGIRRPTPGQVFDFCVNSVDFDHVLAWQEALAKTPPGHFVGPDYALLKAMESQNGHYVDGHCSVFTARSLLEILDGLIEINMLQFRLERFHVAPVGSAEMSLILLRQPSGSDFKSARAPFRQMLVDGVDIEGLVLD